MKTTKIHVEGMTCSQCENKISERLMQVEGISEVQPNAFTNTVILAFENDAVSTDNIHQIIESLGYQVIEERKRNVTAALITILVMLILAYLVLRYESTLSFDFIPNIRQSMGYGTLFVVGLLTSLHCIAMCGGINMTQCSRYTGESALKPSLLYNLGRVISYTVIGGFIGGVGSVLSFTGETKGYVTIVVSVIMMLMALRMLKLMRIPMPSLSSVRILGNIRQAFLGRGPFIVGLANGFMPCGPLQSMQLYALGTGSIITGALSMFYFSLGTFPLMFGLGFISTLLNSRISGKVMKFSGILIFLLGVSMFSRGASLSGIILPIDSYGPAAESVLANNKQIVSISLEANRYEPIRVIKDVPVQFIINVEADSLNGCNNPLAIPALNIEKTLVPGENLIEFTPSSEGKIAYTCWMGMITSYIDVIEE